MKLGNATHLEGKLCIQINCAHLKMTFGQVMHVAEMLSIWIYIFKTERRAFLSSPNLAFSVVVSLQFRWCNHVIVPKHSLDGIKARFILSGTSEFYIIYILSIAVQAFPMHMLSSISLHEILLWWRWIYLVLKHMNSDSYTFTWKPNCCCMETCLSSHVAY